MGRTDTRGTVQRDSRSRSDGTDRGFAAMAADKQKQIASKGGKAAHTRGTAHEFTSGEAREAGRKGGASVSQDRQHMAEIGRRGGVSVSRDRSHMAEIGRKGGSATGTSRRGSNGNA